MSYPVDRDFSTNGAEGGKEGTVGWFRYRAEKKFPSEKVRKEKKPEKKET